MAKYHRKPQGPVDGFEWTGNWPDVPVWAIGEGVIKRTRDTLLVPTLSGIATAHTGDHVLRRKPGDCYVVDADYAAELFDIKGD